MARGGSRKSSQAKPTQQASDALSLPPGLAPPPGLPAPTAASRRKAAKQLAGIDALQPSLVRPPGLESIAEDPIISTKTDEDAETSSTTSPMYVESSTGGTSIDNLISGRTGEEDMLSEMYQVQLSGLPNEILCGAMFEVVLQQARLNGYYSSYTTTLGESSGEALIYLPTESAAEWCLYHFRSCSWGLGGTMLAAEIVSRPTCEQVGELFEDGLFEDGLFDQLASFSPSLFQEGDHLEVVGDESDGTDVPLYADSERQSARLSSDAPAFVPGSAPLARLSIEAPEFVMSAMVGGLSAEAHEFVPGQLTEKLVALSSKLANTSDVSTVDGDSEAESEKEGNANEATAR